METTMPEMPKGQMDAEPASADDTDMAAVLAGVAIRPSLNAAVVIEAYSKPMGEMDLSELAIALQQDMDAMFAGDMSRVEAMLFGQAHALQTIFMNLARRSTAQQYVKNADTYLRLALKAQSQCRATLETLAAIKNPPVVVAQQTNINNGGQQQVNNGGAVPMPGQNVHAREKTEIEPNKLLETPNGERMDFGTTGKASRAHSRLATVGAIKRPQERGR